MAKARSKEGVAGKAVVMAVELLSLAITGDVAEVVTEAENLIQQELPHSRLPEEIKKMITDRVKTNALAAAKDIVGRIYREFNIK